MRTTIEPVVNGYLVVREVQGWGSDNNQYVFNTWDEVLTYLKDNPTDFAKEDKGEDINTDGEVAVV